MRLFCVIVLVAIGVFGCKSMEPTKTKSPDKIVTLSTTAMICDLVTRVGGEYIESRVLIQGEIDPHSYELVKGDDEKIENADIVFFNGLQLEHGASLQYKLLSHPRAVALGDYLLTTYPGRALKEKGYVDPHVWMDVWLWAHIVDPIADILSTIDPQHEEKYRQRADQIKKEMVAFHETIKERMQKIPSSKRYLVTSHDAFGYFARQYLAEEEEIASHTWRARIAAPEGLAPDGQVGITDLQKIVDYLVFHDVAVIFPESNVSQDSLKKILLSCKAKDKNIRFSSQTLYGDCMGEEKTYIDMIEHNAQVLISEWEMP